MTIVHWYERTHLEQPKKCLKKSIGEIDSDKHIDSNGHFESSFKFE